MVETTIKVASRIGTDRLASFFAHCLVVLGLVVLVKIGSLTATLYSSAPTLWSGVVLPLMIGPMIPLKPAAVVAWLAYQTSVYRILDH